MGVCLAAVGDISLGDYPFCPGFGVRSALEKGVTPFSEVTAEFMHSDLVFGNLETVVSDKSLNEDSLDSWEMRGSPDRISLLKNAGFNILNIANNHIMQHGEAAFLETVDNIRSANIECLGLNEQSTKTCVPLFYDINGVRIAFLGYAFEIDIYYQGIAKYSLWPLCDIEGQIRQLRHEFDFIIVSCHWGMEFMDRPSPYMINIAHNIIDLGGDLVLGHHPHCLQGVEEYKGRFIAYSMGNFLFDMFWDKKYQTTGIFQFHFSKNGQIRWDIIPCYIQENFNIKRLSGNDNENARLAFLNMCKQDFLPACYDLERENYRYYLEYEKLRKINQIKCYLYFLSNYRKIDFSKRHQILFRSIKRKISSWRMAK